MPYLYEVIDMPRKKIGVSPWGCSVPTEAKKNLSQMFIQLGYTYGGRPSLGAFLTAVHKGELEVRKKVNSSKP